MLPDIATQPIVNGQTDTLQRVFRALIAVPLLREEDRVVGALCVFDVRPLTLGAPQLDALKALGRDFGRLLESVAGQAVAPRDDATSTPPAPSPTPSMIAVDAVTGLLTWASGRAVMDTEVARA